MRASEPKYRDGSSVATALAAGLASLVLYLSNVIKVYHRTDVHNADRFARHGNTLRTRVGLKKAFDDIFNNNNDYKDKKFLPVWELFGTKATKLQDQGKLSDEVGDFG